MSLQKVLKKGGKLMSPNNQDHLAASLMSSQVESGILSRCSYNIFNLTHVVEER